MEPPLIAWLVTTLFCCVLGAIAIRYKIVQYVIASMLFVPALATLLFFVFQLDSCEKTQQALLLDHFRIGAHRGFHSKAPENSIQAFEQARKHGADLIEFDVRETADGVPIIINDQYTINMTDVNYKISDAKWDDLKNLTLKESINSTELTNQTIPSFHFVVEMCRRNKMKMIWDVQKASSQLLTIFNDVIEKYDMHDQVIVSSTNPFTVYWMKRRNPKILTGYKWMRWLVSYHDENGTVPTIGPWFLWTRLAADYIINQVVRSLLLPSFLGVDVLLAHHNVVDKSLVVESERQGMHVVVWPVSDRHAVDYFLNTLRIPILIDSEELMPTH